jgi:hypothetical protein
MSEENKAVVRKCSKRASSPQRLDGALVYEAVLLPSAGFRLRQVIVCDHVRWTES